MSVLLAWQKGADQKIYAGDGCMTPEHWSPEGNMPMQSALVVEFI